MTYCYYSAQTTWSTTDDATQGSTLTSVTGATGRGRTAPPLSTTRRSTTSPWIIWGQSARAAAIQNQCCSPGRNHQKTVFFHQIVCVQPHISEPARAETKHPHADTPGAQTPTGGCQVPMQCLKTNLSWVIKVPSNSGYKILILIGTFSGCQFSNTSPRDQTDQQNSVNWTEKNGNKTNRKRNE